MNQALNPTANWPAPIRKAEPTRIEPPVLAEGETYAGLIGNPAGEAYHLILLPGDNDEATHEASTEWAKSIGGDLPNRVELALLFAHSADQFKKYWYWSNETHSADPASAWCQTFISGSQGVSHKYDSCRARAVRRLPI